jgi:putative hemolysin
MEDADVAAISTALRNEEAVIIFPSSEVSKLYTGGIKTGKWRREVIRFAQQTEAPILPVYLKARNSFMFYLLSWISNGIATLMLPRESLNKRGKTVKIRIGDPIPFRNFNALEPKEALNLLKKHLKAVSHNRKGPYMTEKNVIHPVDRRELRDEILSGELLGETDDGKLIYFLSYQDYPLTMREISRLREVTFRKMGEGTGKKQDMDIYDTYYRHLVLWDDTELEVVGAYRFGIGREILQSHGLRGFYVDSLFELQPKYEDYLPITVELGRSFVQQRYWNSQALDYLWHGIGAYVAKYPDTKYLVGPVTISPSYSKEAKEMLVFFYSKWFPGSTDLAIPRTPFILSEKAKKDLAGIFTGETYKEDFKTLKKNLKHYGFSVPTLYKQYTELCEEGGVTFLGYNIDESFGNCVDGFITVNLDMLVPRKWQRYIESKKEKEVAQA